jgi:D-3-phosphoglycerate dehydrogenase
MVAMAAVGANKTVLVGAVRWDELCPTAHDLLETHGFQLVLNDLDRPLTKADLLQRAPGIFAAIAGVETWDTEVFDAAESLQIVARLGVGLDNIDLAAARSRGIAVTNVPGGNAESVGEFALALLLDVLRGISKMNTELRNGLWDRVLGSELRGKSVGLIGLGATAQAFVRRLSGFDVAIKAYDPYVDTDTAGELGVDLVPSPHFTDCDVISLHAPLTEQTRHLVDADFLARIKPGTVLINTSRGGLIDEPALLQALQSGQLSGAGLDVFETEPLPSDSPLLATPRVVATMHAAADTNQSYERNGMATATAIIDMACGHQPKNLAN